MTTDQWVRVRCEEGRVRCKRWVRVTSLVSFKMTKNTLGFYLKTLILGPCIYNLNFLYLGCILNENPDILEIKNNLSNNIHTALIIER